MKPCKAAYKNVRESAEIYKAFGFRHLSDVTAYYVHENNESYDGTTNLAQPIGEAIVFMAEYVSSISENKSVNGDICYSPDMKHFSLDMTVPENWRNNGITEVCRYTAQADNNSMIRIFAYDDNNEPFPMNPAKLSQGYQLLPVLLLMLARELVSSDEAFLEFYDYTITPDAEKFVTIHENFYQDNKNSDYLISIAENGDNKLCTCSLRDKIETVRKNVTQKTDHTATTIDHFSFSNDYAELIPELSDEFILPSSLRPVCNAIVHRDVCSLLFTGPAGTGKTMSCKLICKETRLPIMATVNCTENLDEFILGKFLPENDRIVFRESYVTKAIRYGGAVIFEEINFARPQYLAFLNSLLDDNGFVRLDNGEVVHRHPDFRFFATMNHGYFGTKELNQALFNRFGAVIELSELSDDDIKRMLLVRVPECADDVDNMLLVYHNIRKRIEAEELDIVVSPRNLENWARLAKYVGYREAAENTIISAARNEKAVEKMIRNIIVPHRWTK